MKHRSILGLAEKVFIIGNEAKKEVTCRIDTGATKSSIDQELFEQIQEGGITHTKIIRQAHGKSERPIVILVVNIDGKEYSGEFTIANRDKMKYKLLLGQNILKKGGFLIDPQKE